MEEDGLKSRGTEGESNVLNSRRDIERGSIWGGASGLS